MPAKNIHHDAVVRALTADGWTITHDPLTLSYTRLKLRLLVFDEQEEKITQWIE